MSETSIHGVLIQVQACGVLITGPAGSGKSQLGLELLSRGHRFIADDVIDLSLRDELVHGQGVDESGDYLALRCGVVVNVARQFGPQAVLAHCPIALVVSPGPALTPFAAPPRTRLLERSLPQHFLHTLPGSAICVEALAQAWLDAQSGYNAAQELADRQAARLSDAQGA